jgi:26S proteasome regulatory subunit N2
MDEMMAYAHDTKHERIIRGIGMGLAFIMYGQQEGADVLIETLIREKDPILRYGGMYVIAMAFAGTSNNSAVRRLLHVAVSDVNDSVRRAAVTCLGFVLFNQPEQLPNLVALLAESFNPHVRYGACMAVGIGCAGSGMTEAIALLEPMLDDSVDYVRQGAMLAMAMVLQQHADASNMKVHTTHYTHYTHHTFLATCRSRSSGRSSPRLYPTSTRASWPRWAPSSPPASSTLAAAMS